MKKHVQYCMFQNLDYPLFIRRPACPNRIFLMEVVDVPYWHLTSTSDTIR